MGVLQSFIYTNTHALARYNVYLGGGDNAPLYTPLIPLMFTFVTFLP